MPREYGDQSYFPSAKLRLKLRFEEFGAPVLKDKAPKKTTPKLKGVKDPRAALKVIEDPEAPAGLKRFLLVPNDSAAASTKTGGAPSDQNSSSDGLTHVVSGIIPRSAKWSQNGIRTADTFSATVRWADFPIDPRTIRACSVKYYLGAVTEQEFAQGIQGVSRGDRGRTGQSGKEPLNLVPDTYLDEKARQRTNLRFQGWVDKWKMTWSDGEPTVEFECTDNTRLFIKQGRPPGLLFGLELPLDEAVATYLSHFPMLDGLTIEYRPVSTPRTDLVPPRLKNVLSKTAHRPNLGVPPSGGGGDNPPNIWDYLTEMCGSVAHTIRVDGTTVIIQRLSNLMGTGIKNPREDDPYQGRNLGSRDYPIRSFIFGKNISELTIEREFTSKEPKNIEMRAYDPEKKTLLVARFPEKGDTVAGQIVNSGPGDGKADKNWLVRFAHPGIRDIAQLKQVAEEYYNTAGRQELGVSITTKNLASFGGDNLDPDILDMKVGDPFEILVNRDRTESSVVNQAEADFGDIDPARKYLVDLGYDDAFARAYAKAYNNTGFQRAYRMKELNIDWSADDGVSVNIAGINYVTARVDRITSSVIELDTIELDEGVIELDEVSGP